MTLSAAILAASLLFQSAPAADPMAKANELIEGDAEPLGFDYGAVRFGGEETEGWEALEAISEYAGSKVDPVSLQKNAPLTMKAGESRCEFMTISNGVRQAKLAKSYSQYDAAREEAGALVAKLQAELDEKAAEAEAAAASPEAAEMARMIVYDQGWREPIGDVAQRDDLGKYEREFLIATLMHKVCPHDEASTNYLRDKLQEIEWFTISEYGAQADINAWLLAQHGDLALQEMVLERLEPLLAEGETKPRNYALLYDRVQMRNDRPQLYGSQGTCEGGQWIAYKIEDKEGVDQRREKMGMMTFAANADRLSARCP